MSQVFLYPSTPTDGGGGGQPTSPPVQMTWTAAGQVWDLLSPASGVRILQGLRGLTMPPVKHYRDTSPALAGSRWRGSRTEQREVFWPLLVKANDGPSWVELDRELWAGLHPDVTGVWSVVAPSRSRRALTMRLDDDGDAGHPADPVSAHAAVYGLTFVAEDPYWRGDDIVRSWTTATGSDFFGGAAKAPPFIISPASTVSTATLTNPGDVPAWPVWTVYGPATAATLGIVGQTVTVPFTIASGKALVVDTDPRAQTAYLYDVSGGELVNPVERTGDLGAVGFAAIPPGESVTLSLALTGSGTIQCRISPGYYRAW